jgi:uncharacterized protein (TIGR02117 family)
MSRAGAALRRALAGLGLLIVVYLAAAVGLGLLPVNRDFAPMPDGIPISIVSNGFHTDLIVPMTVAGPDWTVDWEAWCPPDAGAPTRFIAFGWGDRDFYLETRRLADLRPLTALRAVLFSTTTVVHVTAIADPAAFADRRMVTIAPASYRRLAAYLRATFRLDAAGRPIRRPEAGYGLRDAFYEAVGTYSPWMTCNEWVAAGLRQAGIRTGFWAPFAFGITAHL